MFKIDRYGKVSEKSVAEWDMSFLQVYFVKVILNLSS